MYKMGKKDSLSLVGKVVTLQREITRPKGAKVTEYITGFCIKETHTEVTLKDVTRNAFDSIDYTAYYEQENTFHKTEYKLRVSDCSLENYRENIRKSIRSPVTNYHFLTCPSWLSN